MLGVCPAASLPCCPSLIARQVRKEVMSLKLWEGFFDPEVYAPCISISNRLASTQPLHGVDVCESAPPFPHTCSHLCAGEEVEKGPQSLHTVTTSSTLTPVALAFEPAPPSPPTVHTCAQARMWRKTPSRCRPQPPQPRGCWRLNPHPTSPHLFTPACRQGGGEGPSVAADRRCSDS